MSASDTRRLSMRLGRARHPVALGKQLVLAAIDRRGYQLIGDSFDGRTARMLDHLGIDTVIDGGANVGQYAIGLRRAGFTGRIHSAEPLADAFAALSASAQRDERWTADHVALSDEIGEVTINVSANSVSSSVLPMLAAHSDAAPASAYVSTQTAPATTVDDFVDQHGIDPARTLLKLDVQGFETTVLRGAERTLPRFAAAQLELSFVPLYDGQSLAQETIDLLAGHGFELWMLDPESMNDPVTGRLLQCDGTFVRR